MTTDLRTRMQEATTFLCADCGRRHSIATGHPITPPKQRSSEAVPAEDELRKALERLILDHAASAWPAQMRAAANAGNWTYAEHLARYIAAALASTERAAGEDWSRLLDYLEVNAPADVDDVIAVLEVRAHRAEKRAAATPDNAGRSPIDVEGAVAEALGVESAIAEAQRRSNQLTTMLAGLARLAKDPTDER